MGTVVGAKLWRLTQSSHLEIGSTKQSGHQVLCITHLPQLAAFGDIHYGVEKTVTDGRTVALVRRLESDLRLNELAQMLGTQGVAALQGAEELLAQAHALKSK